MFQAGINRGSGLTSGHYIFLGPSWPAQVREVHFVQPVYAFFKCSFLLISRYIPFFKFLNMTVLYRVKSTLVVVDMKHKLLLCWQEKIFSY
jgi:hypothetical protein